MNELTVQVSQQVHAADIDLSNFLRNPTDVRKDFEEQAKKWDKETRLLSSINAIVMHPSYLRIIGIGKQALPLIFERMKETPGHWFVALQAITGENPVDNDADFAKATEQWLSWGKSRGFSE